MSLPGTEAVEAAAEGKGGGERIAKGGIGGMIAIAEMTMEVEGEGIVFVKFATCNMKIEKKIKK